MAFPPAFLDEIRTRVPLASVIGRRLKLVRKGREFHGLCPFHNEKTPSFTVNEEKGFFHCFGCGAHGDVIGFEMRAGHLSFPEAIEKLAAEAGLEVPKQRPEEREQAKRAASLLDATEVAAAFFEAQLQAPIGREALDYLQRRGLDEATIARFRLGFAPDRRNALKTALKAAEIPESLAIEAGLLIVPDGGGESYDRFRGRVMFPITDRRGRVIAFGGRILGEGQPKYLNSPETPLFHKGTVLYGLAQAREPAAKAKGIIVCEGYMDVIALAKAGFENAVAPLGTALTEQQIELLWRIAPEPVICLDGDEAGQRAAMRAANRALPLLKPGLSLNFALLPAPEDPDSLIKARGAEAMRMVIEQARPLSEILWRSALASHVVDTPERRALLKKDLKDLVAGIADVTTRTMYSRMFDERLFQHFRELQPRFEPKSGNARSSAGGRRRSIDRGPDGRLPGLGLPPPPAAAAPALEVPMLLTPINHPGLLDEVAERLGTIQFSDSALDKLRQVLIQHPGPSDALDSGALQLYLRAQGCSPELDQLLSKAAHEPRRFVRADSTLDKARDGWNEAFDLYHRRQAIQADVARAESELAADVSEPKLERFSALKREQHANEA